MNEAQSDSPKRARLAEFLLVGGATLVLLPLSWGARMAFGSDSPELVVGFTAFYGAHVVNDPHFSATYLLYYERFKQRAFGQEFARAQRLRYWLSGVLVPFILLSWSLLAIANRSAVALGMMMELMFLSVGWHYVKQGFGVFSVICAQRGVRLNSLERRALLTHCLSGWLLAWVNPSRESIEVFEKGVVYWTLRRPALLEQAAIAAFSLSTLWAGSTLYRRATGERPRPPLAAVCGLLVSVWCWSIFSAVDPLMVYLIPALHSLQYLFFVRVLRQNKASEQEGPPWFGPPASHQVWKFAATALLLGWVLFHALPSSLDVVLVAPVPSPVGPTPYFAALFACVNIHHYFMDAVIWRKDNPETRYLTAT